LDSATRGGGTTRPPFVPPTVSGKNHVKTVDGAVLVKKHVCNNYCKVQGSWSRSQCPRGLRRRSSAARLLRLWIRIPPGAWMFVCCECCVLSCRRLCDGLITRPEESYRLWSVAVCDQEASKTRRLKPAIGLWKYNHSGL